MATGVRSTIVPSTSHTRMIAFHAARQKPLQVANLFPQLIADYIITPHGGLKIVNENLMCHTHDNLYMHYACTHTHVCSLQPYMQYSRSLPLPLSCMHAHTHKMS